VNVKIYTLRGLLVWEGSKSVSGYQDFIEWNCKNKENDVVASGIYVVYIEGPGIKATKKVAILK
ncbi:MAG: T9SS type A sorting domain-containing protein, partial [bacterium]